MRQMRVGNSFNASEIDLLDQLTRGLAIRGKDLSYLTRHPSFSHLASKVQSMRARHAGKPVRERRRTTQDTILAFLRTRDEETSMTQLLVAHPDMTRSAVRNALAELSNRRLVETSSKARYRAVVPSNVVQLRAASR